MPLTGIFHCCLQMGHPILSPGDLFSAQRSMHFRQKVCRHGSDLGLLNVCVQIQHFVISCSISCCSSASNDFDVVSFLSVESEPCKTALHQSLYLQSMTSIFEWSLS